MVIAVSWGLALFEYCLAVPANRIGFAHGWSAGQLKIAQEAIALVRAAKSDTLFGAAQPVTWVIDHFTWTEDPLRPGDLIRTRPDNPAPEPAAEG